jgi:23S rRNA pseudouridine1911/1915/1917 synthase
LSISEQILFKNNRFVVFNKPAGLPVVPDQTKDQALTQVLAAYLKHDVHAVHRIDRVASGLVLLGQTTKAMSDLSHVFAVGGMKKKYLAVIKGTLPSESGSLLHYLKKQGSTNKMSAYDVPTVGAQEARLNYKLIAKSDQYQLLEIELLTGRQHQIRAQLAAIGCPIKGDNKYGFPRSNPDRSIHLHAWKLSFRDPATMETVSFEAEIRQDDVIWKYFAEQLAPKAE